LPLDLLYPQDHLIRSVFFTANDYLSRLTRSLGAPPRTPNGSYLNFYVGDYPLLLLSWMSTATEDIRRVTSSVAGAARGVTLRDAATSSTDGTRRVTSSDAGAARATSSTDGTRRVTSSVAGAG
jgi:hypothetical protein